MSNMKKLMLGVSAAVISLTCAVATSAAWKVTNYDTDKIIVEQNGTHKVAVEYALYDDNGLFTGLVVEGAGAEAYGLKPFAKVTYSTPAFELDFPNREYVAIYADGIDTRKVRYNGVQENLNYRWTTYGWELAKPHRLFQVKQANIYGNWFANETYPTRFLGDVATVKAEYNNHYGFGYWHVENGKAVEYMPAELRAYANLDTNVVANVLVKNNVTELLEEQYAATYVNALAPNAVVDMTNYNADGSVNVNAPYVVDVKKAFNLVVAGPTFDMNGNMTSEFGLVCNAATYNLKALDNFKVAELVKNIADSFGNYATVETEWVNAGFELVRPYRCYQILKVDGVLLDGSVVKGTKLPYIYRYTGAYANPVELVTYKNEFLNLDYYATAYGYWAN